ncbi:cell wall-active antibiotics response protein LiaF [Ectobacillus sp. JY-23]|uniref:cell wall-active antibiotics response protein LiaF n=1 Tax=Ectobacillus sp. JY-23 TaxID=2933872 RepID=UPI001FF27E0F|nr:cell wall-active antibiotics response protein LiaF [Ectobacillus sp. JY-23]UOY93537.1 cell wall-active antibiotics response protein LiaF [Ectobacillus sp. JY-23]
MKRTFYKTQIMGALLIIFALGMLLDIIFHRFEPVALVFSVALILLGQYFRKKEKKVRGNVLFLVGVFTLIVNVFSSAAFQLVFVTLLIYGGYELLMSNQRRVVTPKLVESTQGKRIVQVQPFFKNMLVGNYHMMGSVYELHDINIRYGLGDVKIDLTTAMIPEGETVLVIHGLVGNIRLYVPYDIEISLNHSVLLGNISMLEYKEKGFNKNICLVTEAYQAAPRRIKIISTLLIGDTEVRYA